MMPPELLDVIARVQEQLGEQIDVLDREGGAYARACAQLALKPKRVNQPSPPAGMHPKVREMVRSLVSDELFVRRHENAVSR